MVEAAKELGDKGVIAEVDCTVEKDLCDKFGVKGYPTIKYFSNGKSSDYTKGRSQKEFVNFILDQGKPAVTVVASSKEVCLIILALFLSNSSMSWLVPLLLH